MKTGFRGTFVISWSQTELDNVGPAPIEALQTGVAWSWHGDAVRVDGPTELLRLDQAEGEANIRKRAARMVRRLVGAAVDTTRRPEDIDVDEPLLEGGFVVTNGAQSYSVTVIDVEGGKPLLMFLDEMPPKDTDLWVVHHKMDPIESNPMVPSSGGVICFTPGTMIATPQGPRRVEDLREGDKVQTKDNGDEEICWIGSRRMSGARLFAMPKLRPIRIKTGALGIERPDQEFLVSPEHRMLVKGHAARSLFNTPEVLVSAGDLVNNSTIAVDYTVREVTYIHLLLPRHQILWANGVETESYHPANAAMSSLEDKDRARLLRMLPELKYDPNTYGHYARRNLSASEAAILLHDAA
ncbi:Hint domain-containing protein [uncultured Shimia sp.]|uniref:Hint domain-containing protein n=1 Tax=uncultured Shimia sp. TaxID=573152 RepID=UPI002633A638|nr:Hint domain-containing protein [uncultured Shimia sp.]